VHGGGECGGHVQGTAAAEYVESGSFESGLKERGDSPMAELKQLARRIFQETISAIDIPEAMQRKLRCSKAVLCLDIAEVNLSAFTKVRVIGIGKAAHAMVEGLASLLGREYPLEGIVAAPTPPLVAIAGMKYFVGGHPTPDGQSWKAAESILALLRECDEKTVVFFLLSGGGSALVELPLDGRLTLEDVRQLHRALVTCGASIEVMNTVRKHVSAVKGGRLAVAAGRATKITLAVSDVPVGKESALASGPTLPDPTTVADVRCVIEEFALSDKLPSALLRWMDEGQMPETPKEGDTAFANAHFSLLLGLDDLFHPAHHATEAKGFVACCDNATDDWPVEKAAEYLLAQLEEVRLANPGQRVAVIADGEVSSPVRGKGIGGRNAAFVLSCVKKIAGKKIAVLSVGTDGVDGNSPAAGAVADGETLERGRAIGLNARHMFRESDSYSYFARLGDTIVTGPTGNNLRDLRILLADAEEKKQKKKT
jgi:glycerate 2-kinase